MRTAYKVLIALAVVCIIIVIILGYIGLIRVPLVSPSVQSYVDSTEITDSYVSIYEYIKESSGGQVPSLDVLEQYGLGIGLYGSTSPMTAIEGYYDTFLYDWNVEYSESGTGSYWVTKIWRRIGWGFALVGAEDSRILQATGYRSVYLTVDGPLTAWLQVMNQFGA